MDAGQRQQILNALIMGDPVYVQTGDGQEFEVYSLEMAGSEAKGWRVKHTEELVEAARVVSVSLEPQLLGVAE